MSSLWTEITLTALFVAFAACIVMYWTILFVWTVATAPYLRNQYAIMSLDRHHSPPVYKIAKPPGRVVHEFLLKTIETAVKKYFT